MFDCGTIPSIGVRKLRSLTTLTRLDLSWCTEVANEDARWLGSLMELKDLKLGPLSTMTDDGIVHLTALTTLTRLSLFCLPSEIFRFEIGTCSCYGITNDVVRNLTSFNSLRILAFSNFNGITDTGVSYLGGLMPLTELNLDKCNCVSDGCVERLTSSTKSLAKITRI